MTNVWCMRADFGKYTDHFVDGGYFAYGLEVPDLSAVKNKDELYPMYEQAYPDVKSKNVIGAYVGMLSRFRFEIQAGDWVITPTANSRLLRYGKVTSEAYYHTPGSPDRCPYSHRRPISWSEQTLHRGSLPMPLQNALKHGAKTVFAVSQRDDFLEAIGQSDIPPRPDTYQVVLERILSLDSDEFEMLMRDLLAELGFEGPEAIDRANDGEMDASGELNVSNLATIKFFVRAKRYALWERINADTVRRMRANILNGWQGAFITTADYHKDAWDAASDADFPPIGLINGHQLVDLLIEHWDDIGSEFREMLGLKPGLVPA